VGFEWGGSLIGLWIELYRCFMKIWWRHC